MLRRLFSGRDRRGGSGKRSRQVDPKVISQNAAYLIALVALAFVLGLAGTVIPAIDLIYTFWGWTILALIVVQVFVFIRFPRLRAGCVAAVGLCAAAYLGPAISDWHLNSGHKINGANIPIRVISYNLDESHKRDLSPLVDYIKSAEPDIVVLSEAHWSFGPETTALSGVLPYSATGGDVLILSRWPLTTENMPFVQTKQTRFYAVKAIVQAPGAAVTLFGVHAPTMSIASYAAQRNPYFESLAAVTSGDGPRIMAGDFNATRWDPALARVLEAGQFHSQPFWRYPLTRIVRPGPVELGARIDHVFAGDGLKVEKCSVGPTFGSDHNLLTCEIQY